MTRAQAATADQAVQFIHLVVRTTGEWDSWSRVVIAAHLDEDAAKRHAADVTAQAELAKAQMWRKYASNTFLGPLVTLDPTCHVQEGRLDYHVESVPLVTAALTPDGLHPWVGARALEELEQSRRGRSSDVLEGPMAHAFSKLKRGGAPAEVST